MPDLITNSKARRDYEILETYEAGLVLRGTEVKSLRAGHGQINDAFARIEDGEAYLHNAHIEEYSHGNRLNHLPKGRRKLLLKKSEIRKLQFHVSAKGHALVPLSLYWKGNRVKVSLGVGRGKNIGDKREDLRRKDDEREMARARSRSS